MCRVLTILLTTEDAERDRLTNFLTTENTWKFNFKKDKKNFNKFLFNHKEHRWTQRD